MCERKRRREEEAAAAGRGRLPAAALRALSTQLASSTSDSPKRRRGLLPGLFICLLLDESFGIH